MESLQMLKALKTSDLDIRKRDLVDIVIALPCLEYLAGSCMKTRYRLLDGWI